jgi:23S rRNA pseudouridine2605 synthase
MTVVRLDRALSKLGLASRAEARRLIVDGRVRVQGRIVRDPAHLVVPEKAAIALDGAPTRGRAAWRAIAFHKPRGVVTARRDPERRRTIYDVLGDDERALIAVGRLDMATTGLLILTNDTQLANRLTDPANGIVRRYIVTVRGSLGDADVKRMLDGIDGLRAASVEIQKRSARETHVTIELTEGKNREIRRMLGAVGHEVTRLKRVTFGPIQLDSLQPGDWRELTKEDFRIPAARPSGRSRSRGARG